MFTGVETPTFQRLAAEAWSEEERLDFVAWIAANVESGDVIKGTGGLPKAVGPVPAWGSAAAPA